MDPFTLPVGVVLEVFVGASVLGQVVLEAAVLEEVVQGHQVWLAFDLVVVVVFDQELQPKLYIITKPSSTR